MISDNAMKIESIFNGLEMSILKNTNTKAELQDLEILDKSKADISEMKRLEERFERLEKMF